MTSSVYHVWIVLIYGAGKILIQTKNLTFPDMKCPKQI